MFIRIRRRYYTWRRDKAKENMGIAMGLITEGHLSRKDLNRMLSIYKAKHSYYTERLNLLHWQ